MLAEFLLAFGTLFPIANPLSTAFVFNGLAAHKSTVERRRIAYKACITAATVLFTFMIVGNYLLTFFGITIYAFRVAGGIYMGKVGFEMLSSELRKSAEVVDDNQDISVLPVAIPLISGPGSMTATLVLAQQADWQTYIVVTLAIILTCFIAWVMLRHSHFLTKIFGKTGTNALEKILGLLVLVIAVQFLFNGVTGYLDALGITL